MAETEVQKIVEDANGFTLEDFEEKYRVYGDTSLPGVRKTQGCDMGIPLFPTQSLPLGKADDTRIASAHKAFRHRAPYIRGEAATFILVPYSSRVFIGHLGTARPMSYPSNPFSDIKEKNLCV